VSTFRPELLRCPACGRQETRSIALSVNPDRRPAYREDLLAGRFQRFRCAGCERTLDHEGPFTWFDVEAGLFAWVHPLARRSAHVDLERDCQQLYDRNLGAETPAPALLGRTLRPRLVFGLFALREKVLLGQAGIDDALIEALKADALRAAPDLLVDAELTLRVSRVDDEHLELIALDGRAPSARPGIRVPRALLTELPLRHEALLGQLRAGPWVDLMRVMQPAG